MMFAISQASFEPQRPESRHDTQQVQAEERELQDGKIGKERNGKCRKTKLT